MALLAAMLKSRAGLVCVTAGAGMLSTIATLWWNSLLSALVDGIGGEAPVSARAIVTAAAAILTCTSGAFALGLLSGWTCETLAHDLRMGYARRIASLSLLQIEALSAGGLLSKLQNEIADVSAFLRGNLFELINDLIRFAVTFAWLLQLDPTLALLANLPLAFILWYTARSGGIIESAAYQSQQANERMGGLTGALVSAFPVLRLFGAALLLVAGYADALRRWTALGIREERTKALLMSLSALMSFFPLLLIFLVGGTQVIRGEATIGTMYVFVNLSGNVSGVLMNLPGRIAAYGRFAANMRRLRQSVPPAETEGDHGLAG